MPDFLSEAAGLGGAVKRVAASLIAGILVAGLVAGTGMRDATAATDPDGAQTFVDGFIQRGLEVLQAEEQNERKLEIGKRLMAESFDLAAISRFVLGRYGRKVSKEQMAEYQQVYFNYIAHTYLAKLAGTTESSYAVEVVGSEAFGQGDALVKSEVTLPKGGDKLEMGWRVRSYGQDYRIVDMLIAGVSLAVTQRSEFGSILQKEGLDGLITAMRDASVKAGGNPDAPLPETETVSVQPSREPEPEAASVEPTAEPETETAAETDGEPDETDAAAVEPEGPSEEEQAEAAAAAERAAIREERLAEREKLEQNRSEALSLLEETQRLLEELNKPAE